VTPAWDPALSVGEPELDAQHQEIFRRAGALVHAIRFGRSREEVGATLAFLEEYAATHFACEERLMAEVGYPQLPEHRAEHEGFRSDVQALRAEQKRDGATTSLVVRVNAQLVDWLRRHIHSSDRRLAEHVRARRAG
jgi:hemerythrin